MKDVCISYTFSLLREVELTKCGVTGSIKGLALSNDRFWTEWSTFESCISLELKDIFNRIFVMEPKLRLPLRDILRHPWVNVKDGLTSINVQQDMIRRFVNKGAPLHVIMMLLHNLLKHLSIIRQKS